MIRFFSKTLKALQAENMDKPCVAVQQLKFKATRLSFLRRLNEMTVLLASELISNAAFIEYNARKGGISLLILLRS